MILSNCVLKVRVLFLLKTMEHITKRTTKEKLLSYLMEQARQAGSRTFDIPYNRQELADYLSVERSALSAEMSKLKAEGVIAYRKNHFELRREGGSTVSLLTEGFSIENIYRGC